MTEAEWRACADPRPMLQVVGADGGVRKGRLFLAACCRRLWGNSFDGGTLFALNLADHIAEADPIPMKAGIVRLGAGEAVIDCGASEPVELRAAQEEEGKAPPALPAVPAMLRAVLERLACWRDPVDRLGWFPIHPIPASPFRLQYHTTGGTDVLTGWIAL